MRDLLDKLNKILSETTLQDIKDHPLADDPVIAKAIDAKEREDGSAEKDQDVDESGLQYYIGKKKYGKDGMKKLAQAGRDGASEEELGRIKDQYKKEDFEIGDEFGISFGEDFEIATEIVGLAEDGIVIELDEVAMEYLQRQGFTFEEGELVEDKKKGVDGKACWKNYRYAGREQKADGTYKDKCVKVGEDLEEEKELSVQQLATISDEALDKAYGYGRSSPGNTFGWQANMMSAAYAKKMIDSGETDIEKISDAIHKGWNVTAKKFVQDPDQFDDTEKLRQAGKLEAKLQQREKLMNINYAQLSDDEQEKDRVVARALLKAIKGDQDVSEGPKKIPMVKDPETGKKHPDYGNTKMMARLAGISQTEKPAKNREARIEAELQMKDEYGDGEITFTKTASGYFIRHEDEFGDLHSHEYDPTTGDVDFRHSISSTYYGEDSVAEANFPGAPDVKMPGKQTPAQAKYSKLHSMLRQIDTATPAGKQKAEKIIDAIQQLVDTELPGNPVPSKKIWLEGQSVSEAEYQGREVPLGKPMAGDVKKSKVYVKNAKGNVVKVNFGDKKMRIKKSNPSRRKSFRARHNCKNPGPRWKARYWSCRAW